MILDVGVAEINARVLEEHILYFLFDDLQQVEDQAYIEHQVVAVQIFLEIIGRA